MLSGPLALLEHEHAREADDRGGSDGAPEAHMQRHHSALAEPDQREFRSRKIVACQLRVEKSVEARTGLIRRRASARAGRGT